MSEPAQNNISESEQIRQALIGHIEAGADFTDKKVRQRVGHEVETQLGVPYGNVCKQFKAALAAAKDKAGLPADQVTRNVGAGRTTFRKPAPAAPAGDKEEQGDGEKTEDGGQGGADQQQSAHQGGEEQQTNYREIFTACKNLDEVRATPEYAFLKLNYEMMFKEGAFKVYEMFGIPVSEDLLHAPKGQASKVDALCDAWAIMHMKHNWQFPGWVEKMMLFGGTAAVLLLPPLAHFGILDDIKNGFKKKKADEPERTQEDL